VEVQLLADVVAFTALFAFAGGATNPFTTLYFIPSVLATQVSLGCTVRVVAASVVSFGSLFLWVPLPAGTGPHARHFAEHLQGMWVAFGVAGALLSLMLFSVARATSRARGELDRLRQEALLDRHLAALATLSAGAAHELGTPLGSVMLLVDDLDRLPPVEQREALLAIRREIARCKEILARMAGPDARVAAMGGEGAAAWPLVEILADLEFPDDVELRLVGDGELRAGAVRCAQPRAALLQIVQALVTNAADACRARPGSQGIRCGFELRGDSVRVDVEDDGIGLSEEARQAAFDPFFTTKPEGQGMGLGLFLARAQARQLGGRLSLEPAVAGRGVLARLEVPLIPGRAEVAA
jgi:two-component system sensor histidine kinase RegB